MYTLLFIGLVIIFLLSIIIVNTEKKKPLTTLINQIETDKAIFSFYEDQKGLKMLQTLFKHEEPELFSVYLPDRSYDRIIQGKGNIKKLYQKPYKGFCHYSKPSQKISKMVKITDIDLPDKYNPFAEVAR